MKAERVVLDTSILISAALSGTGSRFSLTCYAGQKPLPRFPGINSAQSAELMSGVFTSRELAEGLPQRDWERSRTTAFPFGQYGFRERVGRGLSVTQ
jgi:hypothetical protein